MNLTHARIVLRPRGRLEILDLGFRYLFGDARRPLGWLAAFSVLPAFAAAAASRALLDFAWWQVWAVTLALGIVASGVFTVASGNMLFEQTLDVRAVLRDYARRFPAFVIAVFVSRSLVALGSLMIAPGIIAWHRYAYVGEAVLLERVRVRRAFSRSAALSREGGEGGLGLLLGTFAVSVLMAIGTETMGRAILEDVLVLPIHSDRLLTDGGSYFAVAGYLLSVPWAATSRFLSYIDGRTRQDAWDVQVRLMALGDGAP